MFGAYKKTHFGRPLPSLRQCHEVGQSSEVLTFSTITLEQLKKFASNKFL